MNLAPIAIFACRRPQHLEFLLESLRANPEVSNSSAHIFVGGPKSAADWDLVLQTIEIARECSIFGDLKVHEVFSETTGSGLIRHGVNLVLGAYDRVIALEDDLIVRADFLNFMNRALEEFKDEDAIYQVSGWNYGLMEKGNSQKTYFFPVPTPWGWGTWKRAWTDLPNTQEEFEWLTQRSNRIHNFNFGENYDCLGMIEAVLKSNYDAWDAVWYLHCFRNSKLTVYPNSSLTINNGFDGSGLNFTNTFTWNNSFLEQPQNSFSFSLPIEISSKVQVFNGLRGDWIRISESSNPLLLTLHKIKRKILQHKRYYKKGFYLEIPREVFQYLSR